MHQAIVLPGVKRDSNCNNDKYKGNAHGRIMNYKLIFMNEDHRLKGLDGLNKIKKS
ncbi:hypothetical protein GCM10027293_04420 [Pontibacter aydingkolensis]